MSSNQPDHAPDQNAMEHYEYITKAPLATRQTGPAMEDTFTFVTEEMERMDVEEEGKHTRDGDQY